MCNLLCVAIVKGIEARHKPILMWKLELAIPKKYYIDPDKVFRDTCKTKEIYCHFTQVGKYYIFNCYCDTKEQVLYLKKVCQKYGGKMSAYESAPLW